MNYLENIRKSEKVDIKYILKNVLICLLFGIVLGIFSKWLDNLSINDSIWWQHIISVLDLRNVFSSFSIWIFISIIIAIYSKKPLLASLNVFVFLISMCIIYHVYTIIFSGFNPLSYMKIWYTISAISPIFAFICWYSKGRGVIPIIIKSIIVSVMILCSFSIGFWYFDIKNILETIIFIATMIFMYNGIKNDMISFGLGLVLSYLLRTII